MGILKIVIIVRGEKQKKHVIIIIDTTRLADIEIINECLSM